jgi:hypothetical protein
VSGAPQTDGDQEQPDSAYNRLVGDAPDVVNMVAYAMYKTTKREWIIENRPTDSEVAAHFKTLTVSQIDLYREQARSKLLGFAEAYLNEVAPTLKQEGAHSAIVAEVKRQQSWIVNIVCNIAASIVFAVMLYILGLIYLSPGIPDFVNRGAPASSVPVK